MAGIIGAASFGLAQSVSADTVYQVKRGDTLNRIAANNNVNILDIQRLNNLKNINLIHSGQKLILKKTSNTQQSNNKTATNTTVQQSNKNSTYTVKSGDTLNAISKKNNMSLGTLISLNHLSINSIIYPGQKLITTSTQAKTQPQYTNINTTAPKTTQPQHTNINATAPKTTNNHQAPISYIAAADTNHDNFMTMDEYNTYQAKKNGSQIINVNTNTTTQTTTTTTTTNTSNVQINTNGLSYSQAQWLRTAAVDAKAATAGTGIRASITVAQAIIESGWGQSTLAQAPYNNLFGIKASSTWSGRTVNMKTGEYYGGKYVTVTAGFRAYNSQMDSFKDHSNFLLQNSRYAANGVVNSTSYQSMAQGLQNAGYATSPTYASTLISVVQKYGLNTLD